MLFRSVSEWFAKTYPNSKDVGESIEKTSGEIIERAGVVHRIDRDTSGILLLAKTKEGHECLKEQFQNREIEKIYHLFVYGNIKEDHSAISLSIGRSASNFRKWSAQRGAKGEKREALTYYKVLKRHPEVGVTFLEAKPKTGRTHQIRVHLQALHHPVVADKVYAGSKPPLLGFKRLALHARGIKFKNVVGEEISIQAPYPGDFQEAIDMVG